jgi:hypothetical protein
MSLKKGGPSHFDMDDAFCIRMCDAIAAGLESAPIWRSHRAWNEKSQIRPSRAAAGFFAARSLMCPGTEADNTQTQRREDANG